MKDSTAGLHLISSNPSGRKLAVVPVPARRWKTRILIPLVILATTAALLAYTARSMFQSSVDVWVAPVVPAPTAPGTALVTQPDGKAAPEASSTTVVAQAPGWIEADPFPITIPALAEGAIREVRIVEGQYVEAGQVVATMVDDDAKLFAKSAVSELAMDEAELQRARANFEFQRTNYERLQRLHESKNAPDIEWASALRDRDESEAQVRSFEAKVARHKVICAQAELTLSRMQIRSPASGVVMQRLVEPGTRISMTNVASGERMGAIARLYNPKKLQVRVDVVLADAAKVNIGSPAEIESEAAPGVVFHGLVSRLVHEANIQRNTVQVKVAISDPSPALKPEMLSRVRFLALAWQDQPGLTGDTNSKAHISIRLLAPADAMMNIAVDRADAWIVDRNSGDSKPVAALRHLKLVGPPREGHYQIAEGLQPGDRLIVEPPPNLKAGIRVRILGEKVPAVGP